MFFSYQLTQVVQDTPIKNFQEIVPGFPLNGAKTCYTYFSVTNTMQPFGYMLQ